MDNDSDHDSASPGEGRSFFSRWGWPVFGLAAFVIFELTASLMWSSLVFALRFGWKDAYAGCCFWWRDREPARRWALAFLLFSAATSKVFTIGFVTLLLLVCASLLRQGPNPALQFPVLVETMVVAFLGGMLASGCFGFTAMLICRWSGRKVWVDLNSYQQAIEPSWPPCHFAANRTPTICFFTMIPMLAIFLLLTVYFPLVLFIDPLDPNPPTWPFAFFILSPLAAILFFYFGIHGLIRTVTAVTPLECWPELLALSEDEIDQMLSSLKPIVPGLRIHQRLDLDEV